MTRNIAGRRHAVASRRGGVSSHDDHRMSVQGRLGEVKHSFRLAQLFPRVHTSQLAPTALKVFGYKFSVSTVR
jgi:hypothetical protein